MEHSVTNQTRETVSILCHQLPLSVAVIEDRGLTGLTRLLREDRHLTQVLVQPLAGPHTSHRTQWGQARPGLLRNKIIQQFEPQ